jgi:hypothetical protein
MLQTPSPLAFSGIDQNKRQDKQLVDKHQRRGIARMDMEGDESCGSGYREQNEEEYDSHEDQLISLVRPATVVLEVNAPATGATFPTNNATHKQPPALASLCNTEPMNQGFNTLASIECAVKRLPVQYDYSFLFSENSQAPAEFRTFPCYHQVNRSVISFTCQPRSDTKRIY